MLIQCQIISILLCRGLSKLIINGKSGRNMEAVLLYTTQVMPALKPVNFLSDKNMLEEGLLGHDHKHGQPGEVERVNRSHRRASVIGKYA